MAATIPSPLIRRAMSRDSGEPIRALKIETVETVLYPSGNLYWISFQLEMVPYDIIFAQSNLKFVETLPHQSFCQDLLQQVSNHSKGTFTRGSFHCSGQSYEGSTLINLYARVLVTTRWPSKFYHHRASKDWPLIP